MAGPGSGCVCLTGIESARIHIRMYRWCVEAECVVLRQDVVCGGRVWWLLAPVLVVAAGPCACGGCWPMCLCRASLLNSLRCCEMMDRGTGSEFARSPHGFKGYGLG